MFFIIQLLFGRVFFVNDVVVAALVITERLGANFFLFVFVVSC